MAMLSVFHSGGSEGDWPNYLGDKASSHFSGLKQINTSNVKQLTMAWTYRSGDAREDNRSQVQCNPLVIDGVLYGTTAGLKLVALDGATGRELWRYDPFADGGRVNPLGVNRGVAYWADGADRRILFAVNHELFAINAENGKRIAGFGDGGKVDLRQGLGRDASRLHLVMTTPGIVFRDLLIQGSRVSEGPGPSAPGHVRAFNIRSGHIEWTFHTIPQPGEAGQETWPPDAWKFIGGANCWAGMSLDEVRGILFVPTGSAAFDFWGGNRIGKNLFANCLLALDVATGRLRWHYQFVHHDLWDRDLPAPPNLLTIRCHGKSIDAVAQVTKSGHVFVFDRETGEPLFPIEERVVPRSDLQGEAAWPTQPLPVKPPPFARQMFTADEITDISPEARRAVLDRYVKLRPHFQFVPPSTEGTVIFPGFDGGAEWGGAAVDPRNGILYVNANEMPWILEMRELGPAASTTQSRGEAIYNQMCAACHGAQRSGDPARAYPSLEQIGNKMSASNIVELLKTGRGLMPSFAFFNQAQSETVANFLLGMSESVVARDDTRVETSVLGTEPYSHTGYNRWLDTNGYPAVKPPWGTLNAVDLNTGEFVWRRPLGEVPELLVRGLPPTGTENYGGPVVTAGGLILIAATKDELIRAFDQNTGKELWRNQLPAGGYATPSTYMANGQQFVVIACGGGKMGTKSGDAYVAFSLPP